MDLSLLIYRVATLEDLPDIVRLLRDDDLGVQREDSSGSIEKYLDAFRDISANTTQELTVVDFQGEIIATLHLSFIQYLTYQGGMRAQIEAVRVKSLYRGMGVGNAIMNYAIGRSRSKGAHLVQLTTDKKRSSAIVFYRGLGFTDSHIGMKLRLD